MKNWSAAIVLIGVVLAGCASDHGRPGVASRTYDCYEWYPYVYSAPVDCWYGSAARYDPAYYSYQHPRNRGRRVLDEAPPEPELPFPILKPPRVLP